MNSSIKNTILELKDFSLSYADKEKEFTIINNINFSLYKGKITCLVGESGCGKSITSLSIMGLHKNFLKSKSNLHHKGEILFHNKNLLDYSDGEMEAIRGNSLSMIFQEPMTSLNPSITVGKQLLEVVLIHNDTTVSKAKDLIYSVLNSMNIPADKRYNSYPHELSGGQKQRIMIAMAILNNPELLIADEPTTALDVTVQAQILKLITDLKDRINTSVLFITHDLALVSQIADHIIVMYGGKIVEEGLLTEVLTDAQHPYTIGLMNSIPSFNDENYNHQEKEPLNPIKGNVPSLIDMPKGCRFQSRCPFATAKCNEEPPSFSHSDSHISYCWYSPLDVNIKEIKEESLA